MAQRRFVRVAALAATTALAIGGWLAGPAGTAEAKPVFTVKKVVTGLTIPWDLTWIGDTMLFDERPGRLWSKVGSADPQPVSIDLPPLWTQSEGGLLGLVADPAAAMNGQFYTCQSTRSGSTARDVRVLRWQLVDATHAVAAGDPVVTGLPIGSGRHNGCRLRFGPDGKLYIGTGDAAKTANPQSLQSLGGKVLRVNADGTVPGDNPFVAQGGNARYVWTYGHRNVQGLAFRPGTSELWNAEHGTFRDDEINVDVAGANYGWQPGPGYDESPPMTNKKLFPDAVSARWSSGRPTVATSGITFLQGSAWGHWEGALAVGMLAGQGLRILFPDPTGKIVGQTDVAGLGSYHRIRTTQLGPDGSLYFTTSNGDGKDVIAKITPTAKAPTLKAGTDVSGSGVTAVRTDGDVYAFIRSTSNRVLVKRSTNDGHTWPGRWTDTGLTSATPPAAASPSPGRVDLLTGTGTRDTVDTVFVNGVKKGSTALGGTWRRTTLSSLGDGTLDAWGLRVTGGVYRAHFDGTTWSTWHKLAPGGFTSAVGASADPVTGQTVLTVRGTTGAAYRATASAGSDGGAWKKTEGRLWSAPALGDRFTGRPVIEVNRGSDGYVRLSRDQQRMAISLKVTSDPDVVTRPDGSWIAFGRNPSGGLSYYDARSGGYRVISLGGTVR